MHVGVHEKTLDPQGRFLIPVKWRGRLKELFLLEFKDYLKIVPKKRAKLTEFFDSVEADVDTLEPHALKAQLLEEKYFGE